MKLVPEGVLKYGRIKSEGKMLEVIPILEDASGQPYMLPPAVWHVENWVLGFENSHSLSTPMSFWPNQRSVIPGTSALSGVRFSFMVRILEDGEMPQGVVAGHIDAEAVKELLQAIRIAPDVYPG